MSQDLFAAFGCPSARHDGTTEALAAAADTFGNLTIPAGNAAGLEDDDDFGEFEDAEKSAPIAAPEPSSSDGRTAAVERKLPLPIDKSLVAEPRDKATEVGSHPFAGRMDLLFGDDDDDQYNAGTDEITDLANNPEAAMAYSKRVIAEQQAEHERKKGPFVASVKTPARRGVPKKLQKKSGYIPAQSSDILFDAEDAAQRSSDDDFSVCESVQGSSNTPAAAHRSTVEPAMPVSPAADGMPGRTITKPSPKHPQKQPGHAHVHISLNDDAWDDSEESSMPVPRVFKSASPEQSFHKASFQTSITATTSKSSKSPSDILPPTNIPPPAVVLSVFPSIFASGEETLLVPLSKLDLKQRQTLLAYGATHIFLRGYIGLGIVLGHIVAGRKLRWKRDQHLAQGMKIGPAAAGGKGGMKLAGVDKGEVAKEEREVLDAVRVWKSQVGKLRTAVTTAGSATAMGEPKLPAVPEITEQMPVKSLMPAEGGVTAPQACALCGLKREERVAKVDIEVNDSFGEWWVDGINMHLLCKNFWDEHKGKLQSR